MKLSGLALGVWCYPVIKVRTVNESKQLKLSAMVWLRHLRWNLCTFIGSILFEVNLTRIGGTLNTAVHRTMLRCATPLP